MKHLKKLVILIPILAGIALVMVMKANKQAPQRLEAVERVRAVRVMPLSPGPVVPKTFGYGYVQADQTWQAVAEVGGQVVVMDETIKKGHFIKKGDLLFKIDPRAYGLAESRGMAEVMNLDARLRELEQSRKNTQTLVGIEKRALGIAAQELERKRMLFDKQVISASDLEKEETAFLARQTTVNNLENTLKLIPSQKKALLAQKKSGESAVAERRLDLAKAEIRAPFNGRISQVNVQRFEFAPAGTVLLAAESIERAEIPVQLTPGDIFKLLPRDRTEPLTGIPDIEQIRRAIGISARVTLPLGAGQVIQWDGAFSRTGEAMDPATGTLSVFVTVDSPYKNLIPGKRPPLATNMYVGVELAGRPLKDRFAFPRSALHKDNIYICTQENRLEIRQVTPEVVMGDLVILNSGVTPGEILVLSDLVPAIKGMKLAPVEDRKTLDRVMAGAVKRGI
jgi:multidrug efflux pump subunit AcrA (membrane-fusion protein)